jgi:uncharacterized protein (DUF302 family)
LPISVQHIPDGAQGDFDRLDARSTLIAMIFLTGVQAMSTDGLVMVRSNHDAKETMRRLEAEVKAKGLTVFARVDHAAGAAQVGLPLRATDLLIFGNANGGTPLMQLDQTMGIDLPLKVLVWQDEAGATWLAYNDPAWLAARHGLGNAAEPTIHALTGILRAIATAAAGSQ